MLHSNMDANLPPAFQDMRVPWPQSSPVNDMSHGTRTKAQTQTHSSRLRVFATAGEISCWPGHVSRRC
jgi:hypothetical protein